MTIDDFNTLDTKDYIRLAKEAGFSNAADLDMSSLIFREEVRDMCSADRCSSYGKSWGCPPACGSLNVMRSHTAEYSRGIIVQTTGNTQNDFDLDAISDVEKRHKRNFDTLVRQIRQITDKCLPMGAGACTRCRKCTYPDRPCRHPDVLYPSMEACGLLVSEVCTLSGLKYNYGKNTMTFTSCLLIGGSEK